MSIFFNLRSITFIVNLVLLLELSILATIRQHCVDLYMLISVKFSWNPYLVIKTVTLIIFQSCVNMISVEGQTSLEKSVERSNILRDYIAFPFFSIILLLQIIVVLSLTYQARKKLFKTCSCMFQQQLAPNQVIELSVISQNQNWVQEPIDPNPNQPSSENSELFHNLIATVIIFLYLINTIIASVVGIYETGLIRHTVVLATTSVIPYIWILLNEKLRAHFKNICNQLKNVFL